MNDNNNQGTPTAAPINQGPFFGSQQWYPNEAAIIQQLAGKAGSYVFTSDGAAIHSPEINLADPNNLIGEVKKRDDDSDKQNSLDDEGSAALSNDNLNMEDGTPRRGKKRSAESSGNWDDTTKVRKQSHNVAEKRRRDKINDKIKELKQLLPKSDNDMSKALNKSYTLEQAIDYIRKLEQQNNSLWEQQQLLQEENRYLKLLRATYNLDDGLDKSKELEAQLLGTSAPLKTSFSAMQVPIAVQVNNSGSPTNSRPGSSMLVWTTPFNNNFAAQVNSPMIKTNGAPTAQLFTADANNFPFNANMNANMNALRQSNPMLQMNVGNPNMPGSPKSNANVNIIFGDSPPKSNSTE